MKIKHTPTPKYSKNVQELSRQLAQLAGLRLRPPRTQEEDHTVAGQLRPLLPVEFFQWRKCPFHGTWLQPQFQPYPHWSCMAKDYCKTMHEANNHYNSTHVKCKGHACTFKRPAKMRTKIEQRIFRVAKFLEDHA